MWQILLILVFSGVVIGKRQLPVAAIFTPDETDEEIAFRSAIIRANIEIHNFQLYPIVKYVTSDDSLILERITCDIVAEGAVAIFGPTSNKTSSIVSSICHNLGVPHILFNWRYEEQEMEKRSRSMTLNVYPDALELSKAYADVLMANGWSSFVIIYETREGFMRLQEILEMIEPHSSVMILPLDEGSDNRPLWKTIQKAGESNYIIDCSPSKILDLLGQAQELDLATEDQNFFLTDLDTHTIDFGMLKDFMANITSIRVSAPEILIREVTYDWIDDENKQGRVFKIDEARVKTSMLLIRDAVWILATALQSGYPLKDVELSELDCRSRASWNHGKKIFEHMRLATWNNSLVRELEGYITGRMDLNKYGERKFFKLDLSMFYSPTTVHKFVSWNPDEGIANTHMRQIINEKIGESIANKTFRVSSREGAPFLMLRKPIADEILEGNARYEGYAVDLIHQLSETLGFKYEIQLAPDGRYGAYNKETKRWDGIIGQLVYGKADIGICDLTITLERRRAVDFTVPFMSLGISILYAKPIKKPPNMFSFLSPFGFDVWINMAVTYLIVSFLLFGIARISNAEWESPHPCDEDPEEVENIWNVSNSIWLTMGSIMGQGCDLLPKGAPMRLVTGMWWFFALMMLNAYTANLAAFLTMSRMDATIKNVEDLASQTKIKYGVVDSGSTKPFFQDSNESLYTKMWAAMENTRPSVFTSSNNEGKDRVLKGKRLYAFLMESTTLEYITERNCELTEVGTRFGDKFYGIALPLNSRYRTTISQEVLRMSERGEMYDLKMKWWKRGEKCAAEVRTNANELSLEQVGGVFLVLGAGLFVAFVIGICEFLWNVRTVSVNERVTLKQAFRSEAIFALKFWISHKPVKPAYLRRPSRMSLAVSETKSVNSLSEQSKELSEQKSRFRRWLNLVFRLRRYFIK